MPTHSHEILTIRLIVQCQLEVTDSDKSTTSSDTNTFTLPLSSPLPKRTGLLTLPVEVRLKILRHVLLFDYNCHIHTRKLPEDSINYLLSLDSRRILEAPQFKHKGKQEINGVLPTYTVCHVDPAILRVCRTLCFEGRSILYDANSVAAIQCGISGLGARLRNYGIKVWGPLHPSRIAAPEDPASSKTPSTLSVLHHGPSFSPLITFRGQNSKPDSPVYICSQKSLTHLVHALWILIKCPFARGMRFTVHIAPHARNRSRTSVDAVVRFAVLPWMHNHIMKITASNNAKDNNTAWNNFLRNHRAASAKEPNVYTYNAVCGYLEHLMASAEKAIDTGAYTRAETLHEMVCYQACSIVRTRTGKLVDVSTKTKDGINRVCKLIAISAFRLCELRSGAIVHFKSLPPCVCVKSAMEIKRLNPDLPVVVRWQKSLSCPLHRTEPGSPIPQKSIRTTRLEGEEAIDNAILNALLALRLPCATPVPEWNIRLNQMLLYLFNLKNDRQNAMGCIRRLQQTCQIVSKDAGAKSKSGGKWTDLELLVGVLKEAMDKEIKGAKKRRSVHHRLVEETQDVVRKIWGERLTPKKGYVGLIWTFRWA
jgi:hypothetical protein